MRAARFIKIVEISLTFKLFGVCFWYFFAESKIRCVNIATRLAPYLGSLWDFCSGVYSNANFTVKSKS